eukprot:GHRQ01011143.1.p1 GENE.GHRQ01011143.1~~GHRQ01011143.1.p1  ORF type:complete len:143 (-),score=13.98 GHRQ01011143.1:370-798(-)
MTVITLRGVLHRCATLSSFAKWERCRVQVPATLHASLLHGAVPVSGCSACSPPQVARHDGRQRLHLLLTEPLLTVLHNQVHLHRAGRRQVDDLSQLSTSQAKRLEIVYQCLQLLSALYAASLGQQILVDRFFRGRCPGVEAC